MQMGLGFWIITGLMAVGALAFWHILRVWSIVLVSFNVLFASLFSMGSIYVVANLLDGALPVMAYYNDLIAFTVVFVVVLALLMVITRSISKVDLSFSDKTNTIAKWLVSIFLVLGFSGTTVFVYYSIMPSKPKPSLKVVTMGTIDVMSKGSLSPMIGESRWVTDMFVQEQQRRDAGVYTQVVESGYSGWKFEGDSSPNAQ